MELELDFTFMTHFKSKFKLTVKQNKHTQKNCPYTARSWFYEILNFSQSTSSPCSVLPQRSPNERPLIFIRVLLQF